MQFATDPEKELLERYLVLGLRLGRHIDGLVDSYTGPAEYKEFTDNESLREPLRLKVSAKGLIDDLQHAAPIVGSRRAAWMLAQVRGMLVTAERIGGAQINYLDEVERSYGVRPSLVDESAFEEAHAALDDVLPGTGSIGERLIAWSESQPVAVDVLPRALDALARDLREQTIAVFGLPEDEHVSFDLVTNQPWSGFNYYLGNFTSRVAINVDLPVLAGGLAHLVAHEAYPGHHTEHSRKEAGLVRRDKHLEETMQLVGTPQCLVSEGLADLGLEILWPENRHERLATYLKPLGVHFEPEVAARVSLATKTMSGVRTNAAILFHEQGIGHDEAVAYIERWGLVSNARARKSLDFMTDPVWRAYSFCYSEGYRLCKAYANGEPSRFADLITDQITTADLIAAA
jgi:hypothetical protein